MAVLVEAITVVIRRDAIERNVPGGLRGFPALLPNNTACMDGQLLRVGFMVSADADAFLARLAEVGLTARGDSQNVAVVNQQLGPTPDVPWLECVPYSRGSAGVTVLGCRLKGSVESGLVVPDGWTYEHSLSRSSVFVPQSEIGSTLTFVSSRGDGVDVYREASGREVFVGRTENIDGRSFEGWLNEGRLRSQAEKLPEAVVAYTNASRLQPNDPRSWFGLGRSLRGSGRARDAVAPLRTAASLAPHVGAVWHELGVALLQSEAAVDGIDALRNAVRLSPDETLAWADLATALWQSRHYDEAMSAFHEAFGRGADDPITIRNYRSLCRDAGREPDAVDAFGRLRQRRTDALVSDAVPVDPLPLPPDEGVIQRARRKVLGLFSKSS
jgi:hypothetical protein